MKVILRKDVPRVGQKDDVKDVSDGYAQNFLIPKGFAEPATGGKVASIEAKREAIEERRAAQIDELKAAIAKVAGEPVEIAAKANEKGHLFKGINAGEVAAAIAGSAGVESIPVDAIGLNEPIKETGEVSIPVTAGDEKKEVTIRIVAES